MHEEYTGLRRETLVHVVTLYERIVARALMNGHNVNTGLFYAVPRFTGPVEEGQSMVQTKTLESPSAAWQTTQ